MIEAKPTRYKGIEFKSRLEARWAVILDKLAMVHQWEYEPFSFTMEHKQWDLTPDFFVVCSQFSYLLEIKPAHVSQDYIEMLKAFKANGLDDKFYLACGSLYQQEPLDLFLVTAQGLTEVTPQDIFFQDIRAAKAAAQGYRFDLAVRRVRSRRH